MKAFLRGTALAVACLFIFETAIARQSDSYKGPNHFKGWVSVPSGRQLWVDWIKAAPGQPTVVLLNGLTYATNYWDRFAQALIAKGVGVFRYDPEGMGQTLLRYGPVIEAIPFQNQVTDLHDLLHAVGLQDKVNLLGLSYGGGLGIGYAAQYPESVSKLILMAPYTEPLEDQDNYIKNMITTTRLMQPWNPSTDDQLYDFFLRGIVYSTYPTAEPSVLENPYKLEATFRLAQGIRKWTADQVVAQMKSPVHLMIAGSDQYIPRPVMNKFWKEISTSDQASVIVVQNSEHKIPEAVPSFAAAWVVEVLNENPLLRGGRSFVGDPYTGKVTYPGGELQISAKMPKSTPTNEVDRLTLMREVASAPIFRSRIRCADIHGAL